MKDRLNQYKSLPLLACLFVLLTFGCVNGERGVNGEPDLPDRVEVDLQVGVPDASGSPLTKASADDLKPLPGELIHSLAVFIVDASGKVEKKFQPDLNNDTNAQKGELTSWKSGSFKITGGAKRIYAFANWESLKSYDFISTAEGATLALPNKVEWENNSFNPSGNKFLPMSVQEEWIPASGTKSIRLVRLVSRMKVKVTNETVHNITIKGLKIGAFNTACNLFGGTILPTTNGWDIGKVFRNEVVLSGSKNPSLELDDVTLTESEWYYVNESDAADGFKVELETESQYHTDNGTTGHGGTKYTSRHLISRNHVWNLEIKFTGYQLTLSVQGENPPIGGYPDIMTGETANLTCEVLGGGPFTITVGNLTSTDNAGEDLSNIKWEIGNIRNSNGLLVETPVVSVESGTTKITGRIVGAIENEKNGASFDLIAKKSDGTVLVTFLVQLRFKDIFSKSANP